jgi:hypothetical protein
MTMNRPFLLLLALGSTVAFAPACQGNGSPQIGEGKRLVVQVTNENVGTLDHPLPVSVSGPTSFIVNITAQLPDGSVDQSFNGYVNVIAQPGTISNIEVRNVQLHNGVLTGLPVDVLAAFGEAHIWADDLGFEPVSPYSSPAPQCSDGVDNNGNGLIDYPADPGCYAPIDNSEDLGTYASGASQTLYFSLPRIELVRGHYAGGDGNVTSFPNAQVSIDTGWRGGTTYDFSTVVTGLTSAGFFAQDLQNDENPAPGYGGIYAYNFSTPADLRVCDRLQVFSGTSSDFYGFTELNYPAWQIEYYNPSARPCLVPEPTLLAVPDLGNPTLLWQLESTLVRVETAGTVNLQIASHFGPQNVPFTGTGSTAVYTPTADASNCDYDHNGKINYYDASDTPSENNCATVCNGTSTAAPTDMQCSEYSQYASQNDFVFVVSDPTTNPSLQRIQADAAAADRFNPIEKRGQTIRAFTGIVTYFSGGTQFTIQARCDDDVVVDPSGAPQTSNLACVHPRTSASLNQNAQ